jgi:sec-independent protein translocase protein TatB
VFGIGSTEFILVALVLLIFVGPKHFPSMLRKFGRLVGELRSASRELRNQIEVEAGDIESPSKMVKDLTRDIAEDMPSPYDEIQKAVDETKQEIGGTQNEVEMDSSKLSDAKRQEPDHNGENS